MHLRPLTACRLLAAAACLAVASSASAAGYEIQVQKYDKSCGPATVATLLSWAGFEVGEKSVIDALGAHRAGPSDITKQGFSIEELARAAASLGLDVYLEQKYLTPNEFKQNLLQEPLIVRLAESGDRPGYGRGHFTIVDGYSARRGFRRADSLDGSHTFHAESSFFDAALQTSRKYGPGFVAVLRLRRAGQPLVAARPISADEEDSLLDIPRSRLLESVAPLPAGRSQVLFSVGHGTTGFSVPELFGLELRESGWNTGVQFRHGLSRHSEIFIGLSGSRNRLAIRLPQGSTLPVDKVTSTDPIILGISTELPFQPASGWKTVGTIVGIVDLPLRVRGLAVEADAIWQMDDNWRVQTGGSVAIARDSSVSYATASLSLGVARQLSPRLSLYSEVAASLPLNYQGPPSAAFTLAINRSLGERWAIQPYVERNVFGPRGFSSTSFGVTIAYQLPRVLGRKSQQRPRMAR